MQNLQIANSDRPIVFYALDVILAVGYRVKSPQATLFRQWATATLHEYLQKGFLLNDEFLKNMGGRLYWKELLERIRDIRTSEKVMYRQILDLYATSLDYDVTVPETIAFFKIVQNKLHYAVSGHTASEIIFERANANLPFMGLTIFQGNRPVKSDVSIAKNYLSEKELFALRRIVNAFFDMAELKAELHEPMYMRDWLETLDKFTSGVGMRFGTGVRALEWHSRGKGFDPPHLHHMRTCCKMNCFAARFSFPRTRHRGFDTPPLGTYRRLSGDTPCCTAARLLLRRGSSFLHDFAKKS